MQNNKLWCGGRLIAPFYNLSLYSKAHPQEKQEYLTNVSTRPISQSGFFTIVQVLNSVHSSEAVLSYNYA